MSGQPPPIEPPAPLLFPANPRRYRALSMFYGYPATLIARWCCVSNGTARQYKRGYRLPPKPTERLFELHRDRRVLGREWTGWEVQEALLISPEGKTLTQGQLRAYQINLALLAEVTRNGGEDRRPRRRDGGAA